MCHECGMTIRSRNNTVVVRASGTGIIADPDVHPELRCNGNKRPMYTAVTYCPWKDYDECGDCCENEPAFVFLAGYKEPHDRCGNQRECNGIAEQGTSIGASGDECVVSFFTVDIEQKEDC